MDNSRQQLLTRDSLREENSCFAGTTGVSRNNRAAGFITAFCNTETHAVEPSRFASGSMAPVHVLDVLPPEWVESRDASGHVKAVKGTVIAGFLHEGRFYTREQAATLTRHLAITGSKTGHQLAQFGRLPGFAVTAACHEVFAQTITGSTIIHGPH